MSGADICKAARAAVSRAVDPAEREAARADIAKAAEAADSYLSVHPDAADARAVREAGRTCRETLRAMKPAPTVARTQKVFTR